MKKAQICLSFTSNTVDVKIKTERLAIHSYIDDDFENCVLLYGDDKITRYFDHGKPRSRAEVEEYIRERGRKHFDKGSPFGLFSIFDKQDGAFIGQVDLLPTTEAGIFEIGCILHAKYHNQWVGTEAVQALMIEYTEYLNTSYLKHPNPLILKVMGTVHPQNKASKQLIENLGMIFSRVEPRFGHPRLWYYYTPPSSLTINK
ncbi:MAG: GNAT family N-acetyltransferase [Rhabdochlamydiaceae bacterium]|jgi:RimJ/RimL family protein N-acetyltransferase